MKNIDLLGLGEPRIWTTETAFRHLSTQNGAESKRTAERRLHELGILPDELNAGILVDEIARPAVDVLVNWAVEQARHKRRLVLFAQLSPLPDGTPCLHANDARGARYWLPLAEEPDSHRAVAALQQLQQHIGRELTILPSGRLVGLLRDAPSTTHIEFVPQVYRPVLHIGNPEAGRQADISPHLQRLENESIFILREAVAEARNPVMLYSIGKDSGVMLHLARKAFYPGPPPFPLLHVDTRWKFQEMYLFRDYMARTSGMRLITHVNPTSPRQKA
jgi:sulfate adenylyltransferase subunit 2